MMMEAMLETRPKSPRLNIISIRGGSGTKTDEFSENFMSQILEPLNFGVISRLWVCFFNNGIEKNQNKTYFEESTSEPPPLENVTI